jgi:hypothetical protein
MRDAHPLHPALITPGGAVYAVDPLTEAVYRRSQQDRERTLPTGRVASQHPAWRWGRPVDAPRTTSAPVIFSPSDLEPGRTRESAAYGSFEELVARFRR